MNYAQVLKGAPMGNQNAAGPHKSHGEVSGKLQNLSATHPSMAKARAARAEAVTHLKDNGYSKAPEAEARFQKGLFNIDKSHEVYIRTAADGSSSIHTLSPLASFQGGGHGFEHTSHSFSAPQKLFPAR